jgi:hypothetical protein
MTGVDLGGVMLYGASVYNADDNEDIWQNFCTEGEFITLSHGELSGNGFIPISRTSLSNVGARLNLLGHIHLSSVTVLSNGRHALYCGCPAGRGFDECGEKGFYEIDTDTFETKFITSQAKIYKEYSVDVSQTASVEELYEVIGGVTTGKNEISRLILKGNMAHPYNIESDVLAGFFPQFVSIKDKTEVDVTSFENVAENTLEGKFIRILQAKLENEADENEKTKIYDAIKQGLIAMRNR